MKAAVQKPSPYPDIRGPVAVTLFRIEYVVGAGTDDERWVEEYRDEEGKVLFRVDPIEEMRQQDDAGDVEEVKEEGA